MFDSENREASDPGQRRFLRGVLERLVRDASLAGAALWLREGPLPRWRLQSSIGVQVTGASESDVQELLRRADLTVSEGWASIGAEELALLGPLRCRAGAEPAGAWAFTARLASDASLLLLLFAASEEGFASLREVSEVRVLRSLLEFQRAFGEQRSSELRDALHLLDETQRAQSALLEREDPDLAFSILLEALCRITLSCHGFLAEIVNSGAPVPQLVGEQYWADTGEERAIPDSVRIELLAVAQRVAGTGETEVHSGEAGHRSQLGTQLGLPVSWGTERIGVVVLAGRAGGYGDEVLRRCTPCIRSIARSIRLLRTWRHEAEAQDALRTSESMRAAILDAAGDGIFAMEPGSRLVSVNRATEEIFGFPARQLLGRQLGVLLAAGERRRFRAQLGQVLRSSSELPRHGPLRLTGRRREGQEFPMSLVLSRAETGSRELVVGIVRDMTEQVELERRLRHSQKMEAVGQLAGGLAHDFNNLLQVIQGYTQLIRSRVAGETQLLQDLSMIGGAATRAEELTDKLLAFGRKQIIRIERLALNTVLREIGPMLRRLIPEHIAIQFELHEGQSWISADLGQVEQIVMNLVLNSRDALQGGGSIWVRTRVSALDEASAFARGLQPGAFVELEVEDDGDGIPEDIQEKVFDPFFTTKEVGQGTGLGLSTVAGAVEQSRAHLELDSAAGRGTRFCIRFPEESAPEREAEGGAGEHESELVGHGLVLLAEDEDAVRIVIRRLLQAAGYEVREVADGVEALRWLETATETPDLVISDLVMPRMGGTVLARRIRARWPDLPLLLVSGHSDEAIRKGGEFGEGVGFLQKPIQVQELLRRVQEALGLRQRPDEDTGQQQMFAQ